MSTNPKSRVNRLSPVFYNGYTAYRFERNSPFKQPLGNSITAIQQASGSMRFPGLRLGSDESYCLVAAGKRRWFAKRGCCAAIKTFAHVTSNAGADGRYPLEPVLYYYIPHIGLMTQRKKIEYIKAVDEFFGGGVLEYVETQESAKGLSIPGSDQRFVPRVTYELEGSCNEPRVWVQCKEWMVVKANLTGSYGIKALMILQFLRTLYQYVDVSEATYSVTTARLYQPQMFFKLKHLMPDIGISQLFNLSFTLSASPNISTTYFPFTSAFNIPNQKFKFETWNDDSSIQVKLNPYSRRPNEYTFNEYLELVACEAGKAPCPVSDTRMFLVTGLGKHYVYTITRNYISSKFFELKKSGYIEAAIRIAKLSGDKELLKKLTT